MANRIEVLTKVNDTRSQVIQRDLSALGHNIKKATVVDVYTINKELSEQDLNNIKELLTNPISQTTEKFFLPDNFTFALEIGFLPGVTDNIATTARETIEDFFQRKFTNDESLHTSQLIFLEGDITEEEVEKIGHTLANKLIQRIHIKSLAQFNKDGGMDIIIPKVQLDEAPAADDVNLDIPEEELIKLGKQGIPNEDGTRRGPLALDKDYLEAIKKYFKEKEERNPTDLELEALAQTWSEHCKHTIFASKIDDLEEGLYKGYIKRATQEIRKSKGQNDFCVSVFKDNSGGIIFDENWVITDKAETHNTPSMLDPFGGAITGIVGVNRDCIGFGKGAKPIINKYGFCVGLPDDKEPLYRDKELTEQILPPKRILDGIVHGVNVGGNCSGIPTPQGFVRYHKDYKGKPLVFVGTVGLIPKEINGEPGWEKGAKNGDHIVVIGGRVGQDGIHGATFSSEALDEGSPATAVQIGDPITQKKFSDAIIKEARDQNLYNSITDNGAGGISCSVAEMARECGGCDVQLEKVPLKYPNLEPWKIWISESQERMTLAIAPEKLEKFMELMKKRDIEATVIGTFNDSGRCKVTYNDHIVMDMEMDFLHDGLPEKELQTIYEKPTHPEPEFEQGDLTESLHKMLQRPNIRSYDWISYQYDYVVQGGAVIGPLQGKGRVNGPTSVTKPFLETNKGVVCSQGINPNYSAIDTYHMAACAIDTAIRNIVAVGGDIEHTALMDNFCWCSSDEPQRLGELKAAAKACFDYAVSYQAPYISGKDSMFNDFKGFNAQGEAVKISAPPTLLVSSISVMKDVTKAVSLDPKFAGDLVYIIGQTKNEMGGSEYFDMHNETGNTVPQVDSDRALNLYKKFQEATESRLISSALSPSLGGLITTLAHKSIAGQLGLKIDISKIPHSTPRADYLLFSETQSRFIVTIDPAIQEQFEEHFNGFQIAKIGTVTDNNDFIIHDGEEKLIETTVENLTKNYHAT